MRHKDQLHGGGHVYEDGYCINCDAPVYKVAQNFENAQDDPYYTVNSCIAPYGKSITVKQSTSEITVVDFAVKGSSTDEAIVFWYDATNVTTTIPLNFWPRYEGGARLCLIPAVPVTTVIDGEISTTAARITSNFTLSLPAGKSGWVIVPVNANKYGGWVYETPSTGYTGTMNNINGVEWRMGNNTPFIIDQFGIVENVDEFAAAVAADVTAIPGYTGFLNFVV